MSKNLENSLINIKQGKDRDWPFNDPAYSSRVYHITKQKQDKDGNTITKTYKKHSVPLSTLPDYAAHAIRESNPVPKFNVFVPTKSPLSKRRGNGQRRWIRPIQKRVWTKLAVSLIKEFKGDIVAAGIKNAVSKRILKGFTKFIIVFPPNNVN